MVFNKKWVATASLLALLLSMMSADLALADGGPDPSEGVLSSPARRAPGGREEVPPLAAGVAAMAMSGGTVTEVDPQVAAVLMMMALIAQQQKPETSVSAAPAVSNADILDTILDEMIAEMGVPAAAAPPSQIVTPQPIPPIEIVKLFDVPAADLNPIVPRVSLPPQFVARSPFPPKEIMPETPLGRSVPIMPGVLLPEEMPPPYAAVSAAPPPVVASPVEKLVEALPSGLRGGRSPERVARNLKKIGQDAEEIVNVAAGFLNAIFGENRR